MSVVQRALSLDVVRHTLWWFGDTNLGQQPGHFIERLLNLISAADTDNRDKLRREYSDYVLAFEAVQLKRGGLDWLRGIAKRGLDAEEQGLDIWTSGDGGSPAAADPTAVREVAAGEPQIPAVTPDSYRGEFTKGRRL